MTRPVIVRGDKTGVCVSVKDPLGSAFAFGAGGSDPVETLIGFASGLGATVGTVCGRAAGWGAGDGAGLGAVTGFAGSARGTALLLVFAGEGVLGLAAGAGAATGFAAGVGLLFATTAGLVTAGVCLLPAGSGTVVSALDFGPDGFQVLARDLVFCGRSGRCENGS